MKLTIRVGAACLLICLALPALARAGGETSADPYEIGAKLLSKKRFRTALTYFQSALRRNDMRARYGIAMTFEAQGKEQEALAQYREFVAHGWPEDPRRADALLKIQALEERRKGASARAAELAERGKVLLKKGRYRDAEKALRQALAADDSQAAAHFSLGEVYLKLGEFAKAEREFRKAEQRY